MHGFLWNPCIIQISSNCAGTTGVTHVQAGAGVARTHNLPRYGYGPWVRLWSDWPPSHVISYYWRP